MRPFPGAVSTPPTPFADRQSLEAELKMLEKDIGYLERFRRQHSEEAYGAVVYGSGLRDSLNSEGEDTSLNSLTLPDLVTADTEVRGAGPAAAMRHMRAEDIHNIEMFIRDMTVPPPPAKDTRHRSKEDTKELTKEDISAFIIPPPPSGQAKDALQLELRPGREQPRPGDKISPKIASLQERIGQLGEAKAGPKELGLALAKDRYGYPSSPAPCPAPASPLKGGVASKLELFSSSSPQDLPPPPPPPRSSVPRQLGGSSTLGRPAPAPPSYQFGAGLVRSSSQEQLGARTEAVRPLPVRSVAARINGKLSSSSEDLGLKRSPISPSKLSVTSSSDSISSTASVNTVKSAAGSPQEAELPPPPSLPPRLSPSKVAVKPPIPPLSPPDRAGDSTAPLKIVSNSPFRTGQLQAGSPSPPAPALPSRLSKPGSPTKPAPAPKSSPGRSLPQIPGTAARQLSAAKPAAPSPPPSPRTAPRQLAAAGSPQLQRRPAPAQLTATERLSGGRKLPVPPPTNGLTNGASLSPKLGRHQAPASPKSILKNSSNNSSHNSSNGHSHMNGHNGHHSHRLTNGHAEVFTNTEFELARGEEEMEVRPLLFLSFIIMFYFTFSSRLAPAWMTPRLRTTR